MAKPKKRRVKIKDHVEFIAPLPAGDSRLPTRPVKCTFCNRRAVTVVRGYPVCAEHAEMLRKGEITPPPAPPPAVGAEPQIEKKS